MTSAHDEHGAALAHDAVLLGEPPRGLLRQRMTLGDPAPRAQRVLQAIDDAHVRFA